MKRFTRKTKRFLVKCVRIGTPVLLAVGMISLGVWYGLKPDEKPAHREYGDAAMSDVSKGQDAEAYEEALKIGEKGDAVAARRVMQRLGTLAQLGGKPRGYAPAHLWLARYVLGDGFGGFLKNFPVGESRGTERLGGGQLAYRGTLPPPALVDEVLKHLQAAAELDKNLPEARQLMAELQIARGQRNELLPWMIDQVAMGRENHFEMGRLLAHALCYEGDDLEVEEKGWLELSTLGRDVQRSKQGDLSVRLRYLLVVFVMDQQKLADVALQKFGRDFGSGDGGALRVAQVNALREYFSAILLLKKPTPDIDEVRERLMAAYQHLPGNPEIVNALRRVAQVSPASAAKIAEGMAVTPWAQIEALGSDGVTWCLALAELEAAKRLEYLKMGQRLDPANVDLMVALLQESMAGSIGEATAELDALLEQAKQMRKTLKDGEQAMRLDTQLGKWKWHQKQADAALVLLEGALALKSYASVQQLVELHQLLAEIYGSMGNSELAGLHQKLLEKLQAEGRGAE